MIMRAKTEGNVVILELEGHLDFETTQTLKDTANQLLGGPEPAQVVFNLKNLKFVGSSGITQFIKMVAKLNRNKKARPRICHLSTEFDRVFRSLQSARNPFEIYENEAAALESFTAPPPKKRSFKKKQYDN